MSLTIVANNITAVLQECSITRKERLVARSMSQGGFEISLQEREDESCEWNEKGDIRLTVDELARYGEALIDFANDADDA